MDASLLERILFMAPPLLVAVILHEIAHGLAAERFGDRTAREQGRISINPIVHIDPFLTIMLPALLIFAGSPVIFGGAKPVPVDPSRLNSPRKAMIWIAAWGPITNLIIAAISLGLLQLSYWVFASATLTFSLKLLIAWLSYSVLINVVLAVFNLLPVPPLDGGRIAVGLLPKTAAIALSKLEPFGFLIVFALLYFDLLDKIFQPILEQLIHLI